MNEIWNHENIASYNLRFCSPRLEHHPLFSPMTVSICHGNKLQNKRRALNNLLLYGPQVFTRLDSKTDTQHHWPDKFKDDTAINSITSTNTVIYHIPLVKYQECIYIYIKKKQINKKTDIGSVQTHPASKRWMNAGMHHFRCVMFQ